jgi:hypothetical protein
VNNTEDLLVRCGTPAGRKDSGMGPQYAELSKELRTRNGGNLHATLCEVNGKKLVSASIRRRKW